MGAATPCALPFVYRFGLAIALVLGIAFSAGYAHQAAAEAARMELALNVTETVLAREQRLSALGALAAAAAHELGTPLATIAVVAKEMAREAPEGPLREDAELLIARPSAAATSCGGSPRCRTTTDEVHERMSLLQFVREVVEPYAGAEAVRVEAMVTGAAGVEAPDVWRWPEVLHAMTSLVENAFDFARKEILVTARFDADDGGGRGARRRARLLAAGAGQARRALRDQPPGRRGLAHRPYRHGTGLLHRQDAAGTHRGGRGVSQWSPRRRDRRRAVAEVADRGDPNRLM